uniref:CCHC-type domain-containing protein n=1 Tax=Trichogramma kaykai TaxID=54128 RepID=A0ABD2VRM3_9HYME
MAISQITDPTNIIGFSRIAQNRICFYLNSKQLADELLQKESKITIGNTILPIRPLNSRSVRIIISNVQLCIPNSLIEEELKKLNINTVSNLQHVRSGINIPGFTHWVSFRRQVYIHPNSEPLVPPSMQITHEGITYNIYLSTSKMTCAICSQEGHLAKYCKEAVAIHTQPDERVQTTQTVNTQAKSSPTTTIEKSNPSHSSLEVFTNLSTDVSNCSPSTSDHTSNRIFKRPSPPSTTSEEESNKPAIKKQAKTISPPESTTKNKITEKSSTKNKNDIATELLPAKEHIENNENKMKLSYDDLLKLLQEFYGQPGTELANIARKYTTDLATLSYNLNSFTHLIAARNLKTRIIKYAKILNPETVYDSDCSQSDSIKSA